MSDRRRHVDSAWWIATFPGTAIFLTVLSINLAGGGRRDALDPYRRYFHGPQGDRHERARG
ncbi:MAG TPA: hypothetical protein VGX97_05995 [bacterium]|nr:hypothetical protein [bacterium]